MSSALVFISRTEEFLAAQNIFTENANIKAALLFCRIKVDTFPERLSGACKECIQPLMKAVQNRCSSILPQRLGIDGRLPAFKLQETSFECSKRRPLRQGAATWTSRNTSHTGWVWVGLRFNSSIRREKGEEPKSVFGRLAKLFF